MNINIRGNLYDLSSPKIMGILNVTPDSFYDGGKHKSLKEILKLAKKSYKKVSDNINEKVVKAVSAKKVNKMLRKRSTSETIAMQG